MKSYILGWFSFFTGALSIGYFSNLLLFNFPEYPHGCLFLPLLLFLLTVFIHHRRTSLTLTIVIISSMLGSWLMFSLLFIIQNSTSSLVPLMTYISLMCTFHFLEFLLTAIFHPQALNITSFLLNQSNEYIIAFMASVAEYLIECYFFGSWKTVRPIFWFGFTICVCGDLFRKAAMIQAGTNFTHLVQYSRRSNHKLVTDGVYSYVRHPTYTGWYLFSVFSQVMMLNPICIVLFSYAAFLFFSERVEEEEELLISFFGSEYVRYKSKVPSGLPFIKGAQIMIN